MADLQHDVFDFIQAKVRVLGSRDPRRYRDLPGRPSDGLAEERRVGWRVPESVHTRLDRGALRRAHVPVDDLVRIATPHHPTTLQRHHDLGLIVTLEVADDLGLSAGDLVVADVRGPEAVAGLEVGAERNGHRALSVDVLVAQDPLAKKLPRTQLLSGDLVDTPRDEPEH